MFKKDYIIVLLIIILSCFIRFGLFYTKWDNLRHSQASAWGSGAVGMYNTGKMEINQKEINTIYALPDNHSGDYLELYQKDKERTSYTMMLPGVSVLLAIIWEIIPIHNYTPYIWLQILIDTLTIVFFYLCFSKAYRKLTLFITAFLIFNLLGIHKVLMAGYDFWPQFGVIVIFIGLYYGLSNKGKLHIFLITGLLSGIAVWFRSLTSFLPFFIFLFIILYQKYHKKESNKIVIQSSLLYILPVVLLILSLSIFRYNQTGNIRPVRSIFWHSFFAGVGRFSNPYDINSTDLSVWEFGQRLNPEISKYAEVEMYNTPNSLYEIALKKQAFAFVKEYPHLFIRNIVYRVGIMISPPLKVGNTTLISPCVKLAIFPFGFILLLLWGLGLFNLFKNDKLVFYLCITIYLYFFAAFSWFYVPGRVILPFLFINIFIYLFGIKYLIVKFKNRRINATTHSTT